MTDTLAMQIHDRSRTNGIARISPAPGRIPDRPSPNELGCAFLPQANCHRCGENQEETRTGEQTRMRHAIETESVDIEGVISNSDPWEARTTLAPDSPLGFRTLNARCVEFIAQPGKIRELRKCIQGPLVDYLKKQRGFSSVIILNSHKEPRLILVMSLWNAEKDATGNRWETSSAVMKMIAPLIDVCSRVQTYEASVPAPDTGVTAKSASAAPIC
jgi:hypothetical protein